MLTFLSIRNVAIIEQLHLSFGPGLNLLTGETGAGKSIIIDALTLASGGRASADLIRTGEEEAVVEAVFDIASLAGVRAHLAEAGFDDNDELIVKRCLTRSGRNRVFVNGSLATLAQLSELGRRLVTIHGQHESQALLRPEQHLQLLDSYAACDKLRQEFSAAYGAWHKLSDQLAHFDEQQRDAAHRLDLLRYQLDELAAANLRPGEEEELLEQRQLLVHAERLASASGGVFEGLYDSDAALLGELRRMVGVIREAAAIDPKLTAVAETLDGAYLQLEDAALQLRDYAARIEADPQALQQADDRLDLLGRLKKKYAPSVEELIGLQARLSDELVELEGRCRSREELEQALAAAREAMEASGRDLTAARRTAADKLAKALSAEVHQLAMPHAVVQVAFEPLPEPRSSGLERVEFLFSPNPGETPRPLARVASGGELSRLMLAFKQILPEGEAPSLVFDEVDTGVGGAVAGMIGRKLKNVAAGQQVFCITHLPQVAAWATRHLKVEKQVQDGRTVTKVTELDKAGVVDELARMLAGETISEAARQHAAELIAQTASI